jgi:hypothetical protein
LNANIKIMKGNRVRHVRFAGLRGVVLDVRDNAAGKLVIIVDQGADGVHEYEPAWLVPVGVDAEVA